MIKNHERILECDAILYRWYLDLDDPTLSTEGRYNILCWTLWFSQHYDHRGWREYHKRLDSKLLCSNDIVIYYESQDESLRAKHDKLYDEWARGREYDPARWAAKRKT